MKATLFFLIVLFSINSYSQYYQEQVLQKSFDKSDYFFVPNYLNKFGLESFEKVSIGLIGDRMTNLALNPAYILTDEISQTEFHIEFRNQQELKTNGYDYPVPMLERGYSSSEVYMPYPIYYVNQKIEPAPILSTAFFIKPLPEKLSKLNFGFTYQLIYLNDKYYSIPQGVYTPRLGYDYAGKELTDFSNYPTIDISSGSDFMKYRAHLISSYFGYDAFDDLKLGFKVNYSTIEKTGSFGSSNYWQYPSYDNSTSVWHNIEEREQKYHHFDLSAGALYKLNATMNLGLVAGFIPGKVIQDISKIDTSLFEYGAINSTYWGYSKRFAITDQNWQNKGNTFYGGAQFKTELKENQHLFFRYNYLNSKQDLTLGSYIMDTSLYRYQYKERDTIRSKSDSYMKVYDDRYGNGTQKNFMHEFQALLLWQIEPSITFNFGVYYSYQKTTINTLEFVKADRVTSYNGFSNYSYGYYQSYKFFQAIKEDKNLDWNFEMVKTTFQIPIYFEWRIKPEFTFMLGLNRMFSDTEIEDVTVAYFNYREITDTAKTIKNTFFGERYTVPKESISDVTTSAFLGMVISPSKSLSLQFLVRPAFSDEKRTSQFWISGLLRL